MKHKFTIAEFMGSLLGSSMVVLILLAFKVIGGYNIPWLWVFAPYWLPYALILVVFGSIAIIAISALVIALIADAVKGK